jgi:hypothetical protein
MISQRQLLFLLVAAVGSMGATYRTTNFIVEAPNAQVAQQVGQYAEKYRKQKAVDWLGKEMPPWGQPCPLKVTVTPGGAGGFTTFAFDRGAILSQEMNVSGPLDRVLDSVLPHEITHTVFAYSFRCPLPRWADEGGSVLSEDDIERQRHDELVRRILAGGRAFRLRILFDMKQYPEEGSDVMTLYAQGYSLSRFLVETSSRQTFLAFVRDGMRYDWDTAVQKHYAMSHVEELEEAWLQWMRGTFRPSPELLAKHKKSTEPGAALPTAQLKPPQPTPQPAPVIRAAGPDEEAPPAPRVPRPSVSPIRDGWSPVPGTVVQPPAQTGWFAAPVQLLPPR